MAIQSISKAFDDAVKTLNQLKWLNVYTESGKRGGREYSLTLTPGDDEEPEQNFSSHLNISYVFDMELFITKEANPALIADNKRAIIRQVLSDRRRGQNAQTTIIGSWAKASDEGREGITYTNTLTIRVLDTGDC